jgi:hypothetical protein
MSDADFIKEHKKLDKVLRSGSQKELTKEAADQAEELKSEVSKMADEKKSEEKTEKGGIRRVEIEPAESGGFVVRVISKPKGGKGGEIGFDEPDLHVCANTEQLSSFLSGAFPAPTSRSKKGKSSSKEAGGSRTDTYEAEDGDDIG